MAKASYAAFARVIFGRVTAQRLRLESDDERSGDFAPFQEVPEDNG